MPQVQVPAEESGSVAPGYDEQGNKVDDKGKITEPNPMDVDPDTGKTPDEPVKPDWCPDKFWDGKQVNQEALAKSYTELESKQGKPKKDTSEIPNPDDAERAVTDAGLDFNALTDEYAKNGELSAESYEALEKAGIEKDVVDDYIAGQEARASLAVKELQDTIGGPSKYSEMISWAADSLSESEIDAFNANVNSGNMDQAKLAVQGLFAKYEKASGTDPKLTFGDNQATKSGESFASWAEVTAAMKDERYSKDPAYRTKVEQKIARSNLQ